MANFCFKDRFFNAEEYFRLLLLDGIAVSISA